MRVGMNRIANFLHYRKLRIRNAGTLAGIERVVIPVLQGALIAGVVILAYGVVSKTVEASQRNADSRAADNMYRQAAYIKSLESIVDKCTSPGENVITIDGVYHMCGAANTGIKVRP